MTATDVQVRIMMRERQKGRTQEQAAASANVRSRKTVAKYEKLGGLPSELKQARRHRTRPDPFAEDWSTIEKMLEEAPGLEAKAVFEWLCERHPGRYRPGQLRTFQRHIATWRALHQKQVAILEQVHRPGEVMQTDGTWLTKLGVTIQGQPFKHILIHSVLPDLDQPERSLQQGQASELSLLVGGATDKQTSRHGRLSTGISLGGQRVGTA